jgi:hypothetical protein
MGVNQGHCLGAGDEEEEIYAPYTISYFAISYSVSRQLAFSPLNHFSNEKYTVFRELDVMKAIK